LGIAAKERLYVLRFDTQDNALIVGPRSSLAREDCHIQQITFIAGTPPAAKFEATGRIRYRAATVPVMVEILDAERAHIHFTAPQFGIAAGQSVVLYQGDKVLGGGVIGL
jgi:tRNA-specific 2-thiouridylase